MRLNRSLLLLLSLAGIRSGVCSAGIQSTPPVKPLALYNVALNKPFEESSPGDPKWKGLTDGIIDSDTAPGCYATDNDPRFPKSVCIDLGGIYPIQQIKVVNSLNGNTRTITVSYGPNRHRMDKGWKHVFPAGVVKGFTYTIQNRPARYVKIAFEDSYGGGFGGDNLLYLREVEVLSPSKEPLKGAYASDRSRWTQTSRQLRVVRRMMIQRHIPPKIVALGDRILEANGKDVPFINLLQEMLGEKLFPKGSTITNLPIALAASKPKTIAETNATLSGTDPYGKDVKELKDADIVLVCFGWDDRSGPPREFGIQLKHLIGSVDRMSDAAIVGVIPPFPPIKEVKNVPLPNASMNGLVRLTKQVYLATGCACIDLNSMAAARDDELAVFDEQGNLTQEGRRFIAAEICNLLIAGKGVQE